jgi:thymidylate synthase
MTGGSPAGKGYAPAMPSADPSRPVSTEYRDMLARVLKEGEWAETPHEVRALTLMQQTMSYDLADAFPVITERDIASFWQTPINELAAFMNGVTTNEGLHEFGCRWWDAWTTHEKTAKRGLADGELGPGSYGGAFAHFPTADGGEFDQIANLVRQVTERPELRTHFVSPWIPQLLARGEGLQSKAVVAPCHGWVHVRIIGDRLHLHMFQRSGDLPVGVPANLIQYAALTLMLSQVTGYRPGRYHHTISDAHIYEDQLPQVEALLARDPRPLPTVTITDEGRALTRVQDFRGSHFELHGYDPHPGMKLPVAV